MTKLRVRGDKLEGPMMSEQNGGTAVGARAGLGQTDYKRSLAYKRLGIDPRDVRSAAFLRTDMRRIARLLNRSRDKQEPRYPPVRPLELLHFSDDPECCKVLGAYLSVPESYRRLLPAEAFCHAAGVSPWRILESIAAVAVRQGAEASAVLAAIMQPRVVEKAVERALGDNGFKDSLMLSKAVGFVPTWGWKGY